MVRILSVLISISFLCASQALAQGVGIIGSDTPVNYAPVAYPQEVATPGATTIPINLSGDDANGDALVFAIVDAPAQGVLSGFDPAAGTVNYTPDVGFAGSDSFTFKVNDGITDSDTATVTFFVSSPHSLTVTSGPSGTPNPVASGETANLSVSATDSLSHPLSYAWTADCPAALVGDGSFNNAAVPTPTWTAPPNTTGSQQNCTISVTVSDGQGLSQSPSYSQGVSSTGHTLSITGGPGGSPNPVASGGTASLSVSASDSLGHALTYAWSVISCTGGIGTGSFGTPNSASTTWTASPNTTGSQQSCTISVTVSDGQGLSQVGSYPQGVSTEGAHTLTITSLPSGLPNPVASSGTANLSVAAQDSLGHPLSYAWTAACPTLLSTGSFNNAALQTPTWTAPPNTTGSQQDCTIQVTVSDGAVPDPKSQSPSFAQGVSPEGVGPSEPTVPQLLNLKTLSGPGGSEQQTFLPTDPIHVEATYFDPNAACAGVAPVLLQLLFFNLEGQLLVTREDVTSAPIAPESKYRLLSATLAPGDLVPGAYTLIFLVRDCTNVNIFVSGAYAIRVLP